MSGLVSAAVKRLRASLASSGEGAGLVAQNAGLNYVAGTIGAVLNDTVANVKMFPWLAKCDGGTDDSAALAAAFASSYGAFILPGVSAIASDVTLPSGKNLRGIAGVSGIKSTGGNFILTGRHTIEHVKFDMGGTAKQVYGEGADYVTTKYCEFTGSTNNGLLMSVGPRHYKSVHDWFHDNGKAGLYVAGTEADAPFMITVDHPIGNDNGEGGVVVAGVGARTSPATVANYADHVTITSPMCWGNGTTANSGVEVFNATNATISNPQCWDNFEHGISLQEVDIFTIANPICSDNGQGGICMQSGYDPYNATQRGTITGGVVTGNVTGLLFKEVCSNIVVNGTVAHNNTSHSARLVDIAGSGLKSNDIVFIGDSFVPSGGSTVVNSNGSTNVTTSEGLNHYGTTAQVNQTVVESVNTAVTIDTRGTTQNFPEVITLTNSGTDVSRCLISQATNGRRLTLRSDGTGGVNVRHNQGDGTTTAGFLNTTAATVTLGAWKSITYLGNGTNFVQMD